MQHNPTTVQIILWWELPLPPSFLSHGKLKKCHWQFWARFCIHRKISVLNVCLLMLRKQIIAHPSPSKSFQLRMMTLRNSFLLLLLTWILANSRWQKEGIDWYSANPSWNPRHYSKRSSIHGKNIQKLIEIDYIFCDLCCPILFRDSTIEFYGELLKKCMNFQCDSSISLELCGVIVAIGWKKGVLTQFQF